MFRFFSRHRGYHYWTVSTLAVSVGGTLVVFAITRALFFQFIPITNPEQVVVVMADASGAGFTDGFFLTELGLDINLRSADVFERVAGQVQTNGDQARFLPHLRVEGLAREPETAAVTWEYFSLLGVAVRGRDFTRDDDRYGSEAVAIISDSLWKTSFASQPGILNAVVPAQPFPLRIIGVAPEHFNGARLGERTDVWIPRNLVGRAVGIPPDVLPEGGAPLVAFGRLRNGMSTARAEQVLALHRPDRRPKGLNFHLVPVRAVYGSPQSQTLMIREGNIGKAIIIAAAIVLIGGCATLTALTLVHFERRRYEFGVRLALGCSRSRLLRQVLLESLQVTITGSALAVAVMFLGLRSLPMIVLPNGLDLSRLNLSTDRDALAAALGLCALMMVFGVLLPLLRPSSFRSMTVGVAGTRSTTSSLTFRRFLLGLHASATVAGMILAGLFVQSVLAGVVSGPGFDFEHSLFVDVRVRPNYLESQTVREGKVSAQGVRLSEQFHFLPGVNTVAFGFPPLGPDRSRQLMIRRLIHLESGDKEIRAGLASVSPSFFEAVRLPILAGRSFNSSDPNDGHVASVVITKSLNEALWQDQSVVNRQFEYLSRQLIVVGVVDDLTYGSQDSGVSPVIFGRGDVEMFARSMRLPYAIRASNPLALRDRALRMAQLEFPDAASIDVVTGDELVSRDLGRQRLGATLFSGFGFVALILGVGAVYGLVWYAIETRRRDLSIRVALGATSADIVKILMTLGVVPVFVGCLAGVIVGFLLSSLFGALFIGVGALHLITYLCAAGLVTASSVCSVLMVLPRTKTISAVSVARLNG